MSATDQFVQRCRLVEAQRVAGAFTPFERRIAGGGAVRRHMRCSSRQRVAVVEMGAKVEARIEAVNDPDDMCRHTGIGLYLFVGNQILRFEYPHHYCIAYNIMLRPNLG